MIGYFEVDVKTLNDTDLLTLYFIKSHIYTHLKVVESATIETDKIYKRAGFIINL